MNHYDVALIGCSGFIANHLVARLNETGKSVVGFGRTCPANVSLQEFVHADLSRLKQVPLSLRSRVEVDTVIFNAGQKGRFEKNSPEWETQGVVSAPFLPAVFEKMNLLGKRLITIGSSEEYGPRKNDQEIIESDELKPISSYGFWKTKLFEQNLTWASSQKSQGLHLRPFNVYGYGQDPNMFLDSLISTLLTGKNFSMTAGEQWRSFVSIDILCDVIVRLLSVSDWSDCSKKLAMNVSGPYYFQLKYVANLINGIVGQGNIQFGAVPYRTQEVWHQRPNLALIERFFETSRFGDFKLEMTKLVHQCKMNRYEN